MAKHRFRLGNGLVNFGAHLARILAEKHFETVILTGICGAYPQSGLAVGDVVRVDTEKTGDWECRKKMVHSFPGLASTMAVNLFIQRHLQILLPYS
jgi:hypothetical protein